MNSSCARLEDNVAYTGSSMIEERDGSDMLVRFHVNGTPCSPPM